MGLQLNIKSAEAVELAREVSALTGESLTEAVTAALRARKKELSREERIKRIEALVAQMRPLLSKEFMEAEDPTAFLYDEETGLPI